MPASLVVLHCPEHVSTQHIVTLWLIGWSYAINLTCASRVVWPALVLRCIFSDIGVAIFFSMDIADVFLALSKILNYLNYQRTSEVSFAMLIGVWTYFRHYQNIRILRSIWYEYDTYVPSHARVFEPLQGRALAWWMKYQVFLPILALQLLNIFWYLLMWRIVFR
jgi:acyl-CoA-dependent ceramide synthase